MKSSEHDIVEIDENDIKHYTWNDKSNYKLYKQELYKHMLGVRCICGNSGKGNNFYNYGEKHQSLPRCQILLNQVN